MGTCPRKVVDGHGHPGDPDLVLHFAVCHALGYAPFAEVPPPLVLARVADELTWAAEQAAPLDPDLVRTFAGRLQDVIRIEAQKPRFG